MSSSWLTGDGSDALTVNLGGQVKGGFAAQICTYDTTTSRTGQLVTNSASGESHCNFEGLKRLSQCT